MLQKADGMGTTERSHQGSTLAPRKGVFQKSDGTGTTAGSWQVGIKERVRFSVKGTNLAHEPSDTIEVVSSDPEALSVELDQPTKAGCIASGFVEGLAFQSGIEISCAVRRADKTEYITVGRLVDVVDKTLPSLSMLLG